MTSGLEHIWWRCEKEKDIRSYLWKCRNGISDDFRVALSDVAQDVANGAPLYRLGGNRKDDIRLEDSDQPSAFLIGKAIYQDSTYAPTSLPQWVLGYGFKRSDIKALDLFFYGDISELTPEAHAARRIAYRAHIGMQVEALSGQNPMHSKLMNALNEVQSRYYGPNFLLSDQQTWPKQKDVVEWLKESRGLSEREANAVDIVARPDALRGKA